MRNPRLGVGNHFRSGYQNWLKSMVKIFHVPTCFALQIWVKSKKMSLYPFRCPFSAENIGKEQSTSPPYTHTHTHTAGVMLAGHLTITFSNFTPRKFCAFLCGGEGILSIQNILENGWWGGCIRVYAAYPTSPLVA